MPFVRRRLCPESVDLRDRAEGALPTDAHLVPSLHGLFDLSFDRQTCAERVFELLRVCGPSRQLARERQPALGRNDHGLNAIANRDLENAIGVL